MVFSPPPTRLVPRCCHRSAGAAVAVAASCDAPRGSDPESPGRSWNALVPPVQMSRVRTRGAFDLRSEVVTRSPLAVGLEDESVPGLVRPRVCSIRSRSSSSLRWSDPLGEFRGVDAGGPGSGWQDSQLSWRRRELPALHEQRSANEVIAGEYLLA